MNKINRFVGYDDKQTPIQLEKCEWKYSFAANIYKPISDNIMSNAIQNNTNRDIISQFLL